MGFTKQFTHDRTGAVINDAYHNIRIKNYDQKVNLQFCVNTFKDKESFDETFDRFESSFLKKNLYSIDAILHTYVETSPGVGSTEVIPNPLYDQYFALDILRQVGVDLISQCYEYLKNETTDMSASVDVLE